MEEKIIAPAKEDVLEEMNLAISRRPEEEKEIRKFYRDAYPDYFSLKRKTRTSTDVKRRYNEKAYDTIRAAVPKELAARFKEACEAQGVSQASVIKEAIERFVNGLS